MDGFLSLADSEISVEMLCIYPLVVMSGILRLWPQLRQSLRQKQEDELSMNYMVM